MASLTRRRFLTGSAALGGVALLPPSVSVASADSLTTAGQSGLDTAWPSDPRYGDLVLGGNQRFVGTPDYVQVVRSTTDVVRAVQAAVDSGRHVAVRSGGHCYEDFVANPSVRAVIDTAELNDVSFDPAMRAFAVEPGATLGGTYRALYKRWGVTVPAGNCPTVGAGGHIVGGGYGTLSRQFGLVVDHLDGVEVVVVDRKGRARCVVATRDSTGPLADLWWAHTGGGGGNFGVVTRYWLRSPDAAGTDPTRLLPQPPTPVIVSEAQWSWGDVDEAAFAAIVRNYSDWYADNSAPTSPYTHLTSQLKLLHRSAGTIGITTQIDASLPNAQGLLDAYYSALRAGVTAPLTVTEQRTLPWWHATWWNGFNGGDSPLTLRYKAKSAYLRTSYQDRHIAALYRNLTDAGFTNPATLAMLAGYGGQVNAVAPGATAVSARDSILKAQFITFWTDPADDARNIEWLRQFYRDVHADTGGVPVSNDVTDGAFINYADVDLADPAWNTSGVPWSTLYYGDNYPRLQRAKQLWDPLNVFHHTMSVELPR